MVEIHAINATSLTTHTSGSAVVDEKKACGEMLMLPILADYRGYGHTICGQPTRYYGRKKQSSTLQARKMYHTIRFQRTIEASREGGGYSTSFANNNNTSWASNAFGTDHPQEESCTHGCSIPWCIPVKQKNIENHCEGQWR